MLTRYYQLSRLHMDANIAIFEGFFNNARQDIFHNLALVKLCTLQVHGRRSLGGGTGETCPPRIWSRGR